MTQTSLLLNHFRCHLDCGTFVFSVQSANMSMIIQLHIWTIDILLSTLNILPLTLPTYTHRIAVFLLFRVTPFKIDQNKNQNRLIDKVQNLGNERRYVYKDPRQDSGQRNISYTRYPKKCFTQTYRDLYGDAMLVLTWMSSNMADGNQQKHLLPSFATKAWIYSSRNS